MRSSKTSSIEYVALHLLMPLPTSGEDVDEWSLSDLEGNRMGKTILVVDDSPTSRHLLTFTLKSAGFNVVEAEDGQEAVAKLNEGVIFHLVITDWNMAIMDGLAFIKAFRAMPAYKSTPVLILTTEPDEKQKQDGRAAGATGWIVKPFNHEQLMKVVRKVMPA
jgi:two-component system chemotaxis response regulator CheY